MDDKMQIIDKIEKLMALANSGCNVYESELALQKAQKLIHDYNINMNEFERSRNVLDYEIITIGEKNGEQWRANLIHIISMYNFGKSIKSKSRIYLFGREQNRQMIKTLYNNISEQIVKICDHEFGKYKSFGGEIHGRSWKASFLIGCVSGFHSKLELQKANLEHNSDHMALISLEKKLIQDKVNEVLGKTVKGHSTYHNPDAYNQGVQTGKNLTQQGLLK